MTYVIEKDTVIAHHGVLGMKWGIRRYQPYGIGYDSKGGGKFVGVRKVSRLTGTVKEGSPSIDDPHIIPKGTVLYRASTVKNETPGGDKYVTYERPDRYFYSSYTGDRNRGASYEQKYEVTKDLKVAGIDEYKEIQKKILKDPKMRKEAIEGYMDQMIRNQVVYNTKLSDVKDLKKTADDFCKKNGLKNINDLDRMWVSLSDDRKSWVYTEDDSSKSKPKTITVSRELEIELDRYRSASNIMNGISNDIRNKSLHEFQYTSASLWRAPNVKKAMIDEMKKRGYNAMVDQAGVGVMKNPDSGKVYREGSSTMIVFDEGENFKKKGKSTYISPKENSDRYNEFRRWRYAGNLYRDYKNSYKDQIKAAKDTIDSYREFMNKHKDNEKIRTRYEQYISEEQDKIRELEKRNA